MGGEAFALNIKYVEEVLEEKTITRVPKTRPFILGIINHRGEILPVITLKELLGIEDEASDGGRKIVVVSMNELKIGILVDRLQDILTVDEGDILPPPKSKSSGQQYVQGIFQRKQVPVVVLDVSGIFVPGSSSTVM